MNVIEIPSSFENITFPWKHPSFQGFAKTGIYGGRLCCL